MTAPADHSRQPELYGHPTGLFTLFFAEMWERFSYYGMRALLVFYMIKGFLGFGDSDAYAVYGAYTALVYMTPFFGGMLADRLLGQRRAVILGGILMGLGHLTMTFENEWLFFMALALLCAGNGFFKPNISTMVGSLYSPISNKRDGGFTLFYMGINLGAALAPLLCGYVGETYGWHYGFGLATVGMFIGLAVFWAPTKLAQTLIMGGAVLTAGGMMWLQRDSHPVLIAVYAVVAVALVIAGIVSFRALGKGGLPDWAGRAPDEKVLKERRFLGLPNDLLVYIGTVVIVLLFTLLISGTTSTSIIPEATILQIKAGGAFGEVAGTFLDQMSKPAGLVLVVAGIFGLVYLLREAFRMEKVPRQRMFAALILIFFALSFFAFFEQAGTSINNFTDRNIDRVFEDDVVEEEDIGESREVVLTQAQLGYPHVLLGDVTSRLEAIRNEAWENRDDNPSKKVAPALDSEGNEIQVTTIEVEVNPQEQLLPAANGEQVFVDMLFKFFEDPEKAEEKVFETSRTLVVTTKNHDENLGGNKITLLNLDSARDAARLRASQRQKAGGTSDGGDEAGAAIANITVPFTFREPHVGMSISDYGGEIPASTFQSLNAIFIMLFGLPFAAIWIFTARRKIEPSTPMKFAWGIGQLGLGFIALWYGAITANENGMVGMSWVVLGYLLHTTGELCLSPVGLSMVTKMAPKRLVSTLMGMWFLALAFANLVSAIIAQFTGVKEGGDSSVVPPPEETVNVYGDVFLNVGIAAFVITGMAIILTPLIKKWMHEDEPLDA